jgi:hypothetical protein
VVHIDEIPNELPDPIPSGSAHCARRILRPRGKISVLTAGLRKSSNHAAHDQFRTGPVAVGCVREYRASRYGLLESIRCGLVGGLCFNDRQRKVAHISQQVINALGWLADEALADWVTPPSVMVHCSAKQRPQAVTTLRDPANAVALTRLRIGLTRAGPTALEFLNRAGTSMVAVKANEA